MSSKERLLTLASYYISMVLSDLVHHHTLVELYPGYKSIHVSTSKQKLHIQNNTGFFCRVPMNVFVETPMTYMAVVQKVSVMNHVLVTVQKYAEEIGDLASI